MGEGCSGDGGWVEGTVVTECVCEGCSGDGRWVEGTVVTECG